MGDAIHGFMADFIGYPGSPLKNSEVLSMPLLWATATLSQILSSIYTSNILTPS